MVINNHCLLDLYGSTFSVGRSKDNDLDCTTLRIDESKHTGFSSTHFKLSKDPKDNYSPVILEVSVCRIISFESLIFTYFFWLSNRIHLQTELLSESKLDQLKIKFRRNAY